KWSTDSYADPVFCNPATSACTGTLYSVWGAKANNVFAVGATGLGTKSVISHYDGRTWTHESRPEGLPLFGVAGSAADDVLAIGRSAWHTDGVTWSPVALPAGVMLGSVAALSKTLSWATSKSGKLYRWDGAAWTAGSGDLSHPLK